MGQETLISWCDHTFNPWIGCAKLTPACDGCYAWADFDLRKHRVGKKAAGRLLDGVLHDARPVPIMDRGTDA